MLNIRDLRIDPASLGAKKLLVDVAPAYGCTRPAKPQMVADHQPSKRLRS
ncbi:MAG: hypothetical protein MSC56_00255 [Clostridiales bacterium]|nr:hypothetical protein [Clostridiales bacterium]